MAVAVALVVVAALVASSAAAAEAAVAALVAVALGVGAVAVGLAAALAASSGSGRSLRAWMCLRCTLLEHVGTCVVAFGILKTCLLARDSNDESNSSCQISRAATARATVVAKSAANQQTHTHTHTHGSCFGFKQASTLRQHSVARPIMQCPYCLQQRWKRDWKPSQWRASSARVGEYNCCRQCDFDCLMPMHCRGPVLTQAIDELVKLENVLPPQGPGRLLIGRFFEEWMGQMSHYDRKGFSYYGAIRDRSSSGHFDPGHIAFQTLLGRPLAEAPVER